MKLVAVSMLVIGLCVGCVSKTTVSNEQLKYTQWQLSRVDGLTLAPSFSASMSFIDALQVNGFAGCNKFFGEGQLEDNQLSISKLGMTRKSCGAELDVFERQLLQTLKQGAMIKIEQQQLIMQGKHTYLFIPK